MIYPFSNRWYTVAAISLFWSIVAATPALGDELQDVKGLLRDGNLTEALVKANKALVRKENDASMQFVKGLVLSEQKKTSEAIEVFTKLTAEHPDYPEPYNNLAVLFATSGQYTKARIALETALKLNPNYATAQENLGDVYLQAAIQTYTEAAKSDSDNANLKIKLKGVRMTLGLPSSEAVAAAPAKNASNATSLALAALPSATIVRMPAKDPVTQRDAVLKVVDQWSRAWSSKDTKMYFSLYSDDFRTPRGEKREVWEKGRRSRIINKSSIEIQVLSPSVTVENKTAVVTFQQVYVSGKLSSTDRKSLTLKQEDGTWKIYQERSES